MHGPRTLIIGHWELTVRASCHDLDSLAAAHALRTKRAENLDRPSFEPTCSRSSELRTAVMTGEVDVRKVASAALCFVAQARGRFGSRCLSWSWELARMRIRLTRA
eukprot:1225483-Prymnesium_polylepis.1